MQLLIFIFVCFILVFTFYSICVHLLYILWCSGELKGNRWNSIRRAHSTQERQIYYMLWNFFFSTQHTLIKEPKKDLYRVNTRQYQAQSSSPIHLHNDMAGTALSASDLSWHLSCQASRQFLSGPKHFGGKLNARVCRLTVARATPKSGSWQWRRQRPTL